MLKRQVSAKGVVWYESTLLSAAGVPHAFSTRVGGVSTGPFASLNLGNPKGADIQDDPQNIAANYARLADASGLGDRQLRRVHQVHGRTVVRIAWEPAPADTAQADAMLTNDARCMVSVRVADCVPILLASDDGRWVAAVHAGWRGIVANVLEAAVTEMSRQGIAPGSLIAAVGPCIGLDAFEVGPEVLAEFANTFGASAPMRHSADGKGQVDLRAAARLQLLTASLSDGQIDTTDRCTSRDADEFFSHRRDRGRTGRMAAVIGPIRRD